MRILISQLNPIVGDVRGNAEQIVRSLDIARGRGAEAVLFAEMALCGYPPEDLLLYPAFNEAVESALAKVIQASQGLFVVVGLVRKNLKTGEKPLYNSAAVIHNGKLLGYHDKWLLPTYDVFDEKRYFEPGSDITVWELNGQKIGVTICEDMWQHAGAVGYTSYSKDPIEALNGLKPDVVFNLSASPYHFRKPLMRVGVCAASAKTLGCPLVMCCQVGGNDQLIFDGYSACLDGEGNLRQLAAGFQVDHMLVDLSALPPVYAVKEDPLADLYQALVLGVRDYFSKLGFSKACLGLSGGIDSALVACIAADALGKENVLAIGMPSRYSSPESLEDAQELAEKLGIGFQRMGIEEIFEAFLKQLGHTSGVTEENLQTRIRGMILMAVSNKLGYLVLNTGNKSEMAVGYCTLYGDMCGALGVIADVSKAQVYELARWLNRIPASILDKEPSAELRPNQKDSDTLPPYPVLDAVVQGYVEEFLSEEAIADKYKISLSVVKDLVHRIHLAEYKRRQAPPGLRVTKRAFSAGRRYPIVQKWS